MSCRSCHHWRQNPGFDYKTDDEKDSHGKCLRYPRPEETPAMHYCGEYVQEKSKYGDHWSKMEDLEESFDDRGRWWTEERDKRLKLEKRLKALRAKLKKMRHDTNTTTKM